METSKMNTIYENKKWIITAYKHVNGSYNGVVTSKETKKVWHWFRLNNKRKIVRYNTSTNDLPQYIKDIIIGTLEREPTTVQLITEDLSFYNGCFPF